MGFACKSSRRRLLWKNFDAQPRRGTPKLVVLGKKRQFCREILRS
jgi:hypothetical protein